MTTPSSPLTPAKARLSEDQKKKNHIESEKKRREAIRAAFDKLCEIVPDMQGQARSEAIVLGATVDHMRDEIARRDEVTRLALAQGMTISEINNVYREIDQAGRAQDESERVYRETGMTHQQAAQQAAYDIAQRSNQSSSRGAMPSPQAVAPARRSPNTGSERGGDS